MADQGSVSGSSFNDDESEDELIMSDFDASLEKIGRGFPKINFGSIWSGKTTESDTSSVTEGDYGHWSRNFQMNTFLNDLHKGLSFPNALTRLQTVKAITEQAISNAMKSRDQSGNNGASEEAETRVGAKEEPAGLIPAVKPKNAPAYNDMVIPQDKDPQLLEEELLLLTELPKDQNNDKDALRQRIQHIQSLEIEPTKKAMMMQRLMMGKYMEEPKRQPTPQQNVLCTHRVPTNTEKEPTYHQSGVFGCQHYERNCKLQCHRCLCWYTCRFCHDESPEIKNSHNPHLFQRSKTEQILCMRCQHVQKPQKYCENCDEEMAMYFCSECKLFDNDETKDIYHCDKCGICRLGLGLGIDFFHCDGCQACLSIELQGNHKCIERATMSSCPICGDFMFTSVKPVVYMSPCGHAIHQHCFDEYTKHSYKCPSCQVSILNMEAQFRVLDKEIEEQPLPVPYCDWICYVSCNDCKAKSTCRYHILGLRCGNCMSYNTTQIKLVKPEEEVAESHDHDTSVEDFANDKALGHLNSMRHELLSGHFQREDVSPLITMENDGKLSNFEQYMSEYFHDVPEDSRKTKRQEFLEYSSQHLFNAAGLFKSNSPREGRSSNSDAAAEAGPTNTINSTGMVRAPSLTDRLRQFINDAPPQLSISDAFQRFIQGSHQGLSSGDEDDDFSARSESERSRSSTTDL
ncbi:LANO_0D05072g1_1 [Lachancea nothofagi CBS 11611]|uniref:LANO_0D05072g1_1 n=1 Tax=Lachancea nothofagi CBS 11611 TaxID=1266666 RepID=A0A1G4JGK1_9SACH|nr:LANO_0D05072g1_1 [Lachancea nothofagi CBS 11611]